MECSSWTPAKTNAGSGMNLDFGIIPSAEQADGRHNPLATAISSTQTQQSNAAASWGRRFLRPLYSYWTERPSSDVEKKDAFNPKILACLESKKTDPESIQATLAGIFGKRIIDEVFTRYGFSKAPSLCGNDLQTILAGIAVRLRHSDLSALHDKLKNIDQLDKANNLLLHLSEDQCFKLITICKENAFEQLNRQQLEKLINVFRKTWDAEGLEGEVSFPPLPTSTLELREDQKLLEMLKGWANFKNDHLPEQAAAEFMSRKPAYCPLREGMVIPCRFQNTDQPTFFAVRGAIDDRNEDFRFSVLQGIASDNRYELRALSQGTIPDSTQSWVHNFAPSSGYDIYQKKASAINEMIKNCCRDIGKGASLEFNGHSQGGGISQLACEGILSNIYNSLKDNGSNPLFGLRSIKTAVWNSPGINEDLALKFCESAAEMERHPQTAGCTIDISYNLVRSQNGINSYFFCDVVHQCGSVFLGCYRKSLNVNTQVHSYETTSRKPILGPHCSPILLKNRGSENTYNWHTVNDIRKEALKIKQQLFLLGFFAKMLSSEQSIANITRHCASLEEKNFLSKLQNLTVDESREILGTAEGSQYVQGLNISDADLTELVLDLGYIKDLQREYPLVEALLALRENSDFAENLKNLELSELFEARKRHQILLEKELLKIENHAKEIDPMLLFTLYQQLSNYDKSTCGRLLDMSKSCLYTALDTNQTTATRVAYAAPLLGVPAAAAVGTGIAMVSAPVTVGLLAGFGITSAGLTIATSKLYRMIVG